MTTFLFRHPAIARCGTRPELGGTADRLVLRVSHTGMLFSAAVARAAAAFLKTGRFSR